MGRGSSKLKGIPYGTEYRTLHQMGNVKFIKPNKGSTTAPDYTETPGRIYATIGKKNEVKFITFYGSDGKRSKQIDVSGIAHRVNGKKIIPHVHLGLHSDKAYKPSKKERRQIALIVREWYNFNNR